jgi:hypothetical protein
MRWKVADMTGCRSKSFRFGPQALRLSIFEQRPSTSDGLLKALPARRILLKLCSERQRESL